MPYVKKKDRKYFYKKYYLRQPIKIWNDTPQVKTGYLTVYHIEKGMAMVCLRRKPFHWGYWLILHVSALASVIQDQEPETE